MATVQFTETLLRELRDLETASLYLQEAFETGSELEIEKSIRFVMQANGWEYTEPLSLSQIGRFLQAQGIQVSLRKKAA